jgi:hypothetical protein
MGNYSYVIQKLSYKKVFCHPFAINRMCKTLSSTCHSEPIFFIPVSNFDQYCALSFQYSAKAWITQKLSSIK